MTDNAKRVLKFLKDNHGMSITAQDIVSELGLTINAVTGSVNGLVAKERAVRTEEVKEGVDGKPVTVKYISLTDAGMNYDPVAEEEALAKAKAEAKAAREAEKARKAAEKAEANA